MRFKRIFYILLVEILKNEKWAIVINYWTIYNNIIVVNTYVKYIYKYKFIIYNIFILVPNDSYDKQFSLRIWEDVENDFISTRNHNILSGIRYNPKYALNSD